MLYCNFRMHSLRQNFDFGYLIWKMSARWFSTSYSPRLLFKNFIRQGQDVQLPIHAFNRTVALEIRFQRVLLTSLIRHSVWRRSTSTESASQRPKGSRLQQPSLQILNLKQFLTFLLITDWRYFRRRSLLLFTKKNQAWCDCSRMHSRIIFNY